MNLKNGKVFTSKFVGAGPSFYGKRIYRTAVSQSLRNTALYAFMKWSGQLSLYQPENKTPNSRSSISSRLNSLTVWLVIRRYSVSPTHRVNLLAPELFFLILAHSVYKMLIIQEPNTLELWNKLHFEEKKNGEYIPCLKYLVPIFVE